MSVILLPEVQEYMRKLQVILYEKDYFGFEEAAQRYTDELLDDILATLPNCLSKPAPEYFNKYGTGMEYASFKKNKRTTWYVFFETYEVNGEIIYLVRYIANNHTVAQYL